MRITRTMLQARVDRLNAVLNRPATAWTRTSSDGKVLDPKKNYKNAEGVNDSKLTSNQGHFLLDSYSPGDGWTRYTLSSIVGQNGGQHNISPTCTAQEMWTYLRGVFDVLDNEYTRNFDKANGVQS